MNKIFIACIILLTFFQAHADQTAEEAFTSIYTNNIWGTNINGEGHSGSGSTLEATELYRDFLQGFFKTFNIHSVVDFGCGDWEFSQAIDWNGIDYFGLDLVSHVIAKNQQYFTKQNIHFIQCNGLTMDLPSADLLICKDVLQHLTNEDIMKFMSQLYKFKHCLITNDVDYYTQTSDNPNIARGDYRYLDLTRPPFNIQGFKIFTYMGVKQVLFITNSNFPGSAK